MTTAAKIMQDIRSLCPGHHGKARPNDIEHIVQHHIREYEERVQGLVKALKDIKDWNDDLEYEWQDQGYRAISALKKFNKGLPGGESTLPELAFPTGTDPDNDSAAGEKS